MGHYITRGHTDLVLSENGTLTVMYMSEKISYKSRLLQICSFHFTMNINGVHHFSEQEINNRAFILSAGILPGKIISLATCISIILRHLRIFFKHRICFRTSTRSVIFQLLFPSTNFRARMFLSSFQQVNASFIKMRTRKFVTGWIWDRTVNNNCPIPQH